MSVLKEYLSLTIVAMEMGKKLFQLLQQRLQRGKIASSKTRIIYIWATFDKTDLTGIVQSDKKMLQSQKGYIFSKSVQKLKSLLHYIPNFYNFVFKIETVWATRFVWPIL